jgi:hypothetical protein
MRCVSGGVLRNSFPQNTLPIYMAICPLWLWKWGLKRERERERGVEIKIFFKKLKGIYNGYAKNVIYFLFYFFGAEFCQFY